LLLEDLDKINSQYLQSLCDQRCPESPSLDFKRNLPGNSDREKQEFLKDVCAMANSDGGDIVYGVEEADGCASVVASLSGEVPDAASRRLLQILDAGIEPHITGFVLHQIDTAAGYVLLIRVPASYDGPHCIRVNASRRFVTRNGTSTADMSYDQIRSAFDRTATLAERSRRSIAERLQAIAQRKTPTPLMAGPTWVLHIVPLSGIAERRFVNLREVYNGSFTDFLGKGWDGGTRSFNFDGLAIHPGDSLGDGHYSYVHIFRTGVLEGGQLGGAKRQVGSNGPERAIVWSLSMSQYFHERAETFLRALKRWGFSGPALLQLALLNVQAFELGIGEVFHQFSHSTADRPHLIPPGVWIDAIDQTDVDVALRPSLDMVWQAFGQDRCLDFDENSGKYSPRKGLIC
jgi:Putative DNA-binding domain